MSLSTRLFTAVRSISLHIRQLAEASCTEACKGDRRVLRERVERFLVFHHRYAFSMSIFYPTRIVTPYSNSFNAEDRFLSST